MGFCSNAWSQEWNGKVEHWHCMGAAHGAGLSFQKWKVVYIFLLVSLCIFRVVWWFISNSSNYFGCLDVKSELYLGMSVACVRWARVSQESGELFSGLRLLLRSLSAMHKKASLQTFVCFILCFRILSDKRICLLEIMLLKTCPLSFCRKKLPVKDESLIPVSVLKFCRCSDLLYVVSDINILNELGSRESTGWLHCWISRQKPWWLNGPNGRQHLPTQTFQSAYTVIFFSPQL